MISRDWLLQRDVCTTPDERVLSQNELDAVRQVLDSFGRAMNGLELPCDFVIIPGEREAGVARTFDGRCVVTIPLAKIAMLSQIALAMCPVCDFVDRQPFGVIGEEEIRIIKVTLMRIVVRAQSKRLGLTVSELAAGLRSAELEAPFANEEIAFDNLWWDVIPDAERWELLVKFAEQRQRLPSRGYPLPWTRLAPCALGLTALHEAAHVQLGHLDIRRDFDRDSPRAMPGEPPSTVWVLAHEVIFDNIASQFGWPSVEATVYRDYWWRLKEFQADWRALEGMLLGTVETSWTTGDRTALAGLCRAALWGLFLGFSIIFVQEAVVDGCGISIFERDGGTSSSNYPSAVIRLGVLIARMTEEIFAQLDWQSEAMKFLKVISILAHQLRCEPLRALGAVVVCLMETGGIATDEVRDWMQASRAADEEAYELGPAWLRKTGRGSDLELKSLFERHAGLARSQRLLRELDFKAHNSPS